MISRFLIYFKRSWPSLNAIPKQRLWKKQQVQRMSAWIRMEESMLRNSLWCDIRYSLDVFHLKKIIWKRPFNVVTLFRLARRGRPRHLQPHPKTLKGRLHLMITSRFHPMAKLSFRKYCPQRRITFGIPEPT